MHRTQCLAAATLLASFAVALGCTTPAARSSDGGAREGGTLHDGGPDVASPARDAVAPRDALVPGRDAANAEAGRGDAGRAPSRLSETGLFSDLTTGVVAPGVREVTPNYVLWSDGATKRRWVSFPEGSVIDTSDMDHWRYPVGTRAWKEFTRDGVRVETRLLEKVADGEWVMMAYRWAEDASDAYAVPEGAHDANGTAHDIPSSRDCASCHGNVPDVLLGVTAVQLSGAPALSLEALAAEGALSDAPVEPFVVPGDAASRSALGYLHANCGHCHNPKSELWTTLDLELWLPVAKLATVEGTPSIASTVGVEPAVPWGGTVARIDPGHPERSVAFQRMKSRGRHAGEILLDMPPLATENVDPDGLSLVESFITSLAPPGGDR